MLNYKSKFMVYSGVHFKSCPVNIREAFSLISQGEIVKKSIFKITQCHYEFVNIGTCNRFDICFFGNLSKKQIIDIYYDLFSDYITEHGKKNNDLGCAELNQRDPDSFLMLNNEDISHYINYYVDLDALRHLFRVTSSLDSLVLGEQQILGQVKAAYLKCLERGYARKNANIIFNQNFKVAKKIRNQTDIGKNSLSIGNAVIEMIYNVFDTFKEKKILIIGAGNMAKIIAKNFISSGAVEIAIANRTYENAKNLALELNLDFIHLSKALIEIHNYDICITAVSGFDDIITDEIMKNYNKKREGNLTVFIDVSVPRKISSKINNIDNLFLFYIDELEQVMNKNKELRMQSAIEAEKIIESEIQFFHSLSKQKENLKHVAKMHHWIKNLINYEVDRYFYDIARGKKNSRSVIADAVTKKIISNIADLSKENQKVDMTSKSIGEIIDYLFNLSSQEEVYFSKSNKDKNIIHLNKKRITKFGHTS